MEILDENSKVLDTTDEQVNLLRMLWDANEEVFEAAIYHLYKEQHQAAKTSDRKPTQNVISILTMNSYCQSKTAQRKQCA